MGLLKGSLAGAIVPSSGTQPPTLLRKDGELPCKVVITSTHALPTSQGVAYGKGSHYYQHSGINYMYSERVGASEKLK